MTGLLQGLVTVVLFFLILGSTVIVHELGHFFAARLAGMRILEFGIGFPPRAKVIRDRGETVYTLNWLPIGGFVKLEGEEDDSADPRSFARKPLLVQILVLVAGVAMNIALAFAIFTSITLTGDPAIGVYVPYVDPGSPAEVAGIVPGDVIEQVDGRAFGAFGQVTILDDLRAKAGQTVALRVRHANDTTTDVTAKLRTATDIAAGKGALGIGRAAVVDPATGDVTVPGIPVELRTTPDRIRYSVGDAVSKGWDRTVSATRLIISGVGQIVSDLISNPSAPPPNISGPVGIASEVGNVFWTLGPIITLYFAGILSANLAVVNILPLPPLDGGRILVIVLKRLLGGRLSLRAERLTYIVGFALLFAFLIWVTAFDVMRQFGGA
jgi:regulator of sigma E protease